MVAPFGLTNVAFPSLHVQLGDVPQRAAVAMRAPAVDHFCHRIQCFCHSLKLTWNTKMDSVWRSFLFQAGIFKFHACFPPNLISSQIQKSTLSMLLVNIGQSAMSSRRITISGQLTIIPKPECFGHVGDSSLPTTHHLGIIPNRE